MIRTFHTVGQGAFYTEEFSDFRFVYDCGTDTDGKGRIEKYVKNHFRKGDIIDAMFISHFHRDHINGLEYLLSNFEVKYIFIPQYSVYEQVLDFMYTDRNLNLFDTKLTVLPVDAIKSISSKTKVILVKKHSRSDEKNDDENDEIQNIGQLEDGDHIDSGKPLQPSQPCTHDWVFVPVNYNNCANSEVFKSHLNKLGIHFQTTSDFINSWQNKKQRTSINSAFKKLPKSPNENSMVVYSGPKVNSKKHSISRVHCNKFPHNIFFEYISNDAGCIYFGDYETHDDAWSTIKDALGKYYDLAGVIQIPHHGSSKNFRNEIIQSALFSVISYGTTNDHGHPGSFTTTSIVKNHGILLEVTENPYSRVYFLVE
ncbi:MBL fold metallo-hydrolase [Serratia marcescens]|uniref:MBL fold metallo-hydrolase n=1 Tax=Serratia marcescens TaxID=615 RepID=UPI0039B510F1